MTIALCCIEEKRSTYHDKLCDQLIEKNQVYHIDIYSTPYIIFYQLEDGVVYDYIFIDIETYSHFKLDDFFVSHKIDTTPIAIITSESKIKSFNSKKAIVECFLEDFFDENQSKLCIENKTNYYAFKIKQRIIRIPYNEIIYIESCNSRCIIHTYNDHCYPVYHKSLKQIADSLNSVRFLKLNRSFIVNMDYIISLDNNFCTLKKGECLPISKNCCKNIRRIFHLYIITDFNKISEETFRRLIAEYK